MVSFKRFKNEQKETPMDAPAKVNYFDIVGQARRSYSKALEPVCQAWHLTRNELDVLLFLHNNPEFDRAADIVSHRGIAKSHVSLSVTALASRGLLERRFTSRDRRTAHLKLTPSGTAIAREARSIQESFFARLFAGIPAEELALWQKLVDQVRQNIEKMQF